jgi:protein-S-isoprenylcysteine O-methyltransferase Ste14
MTNASPITDPGVRIPPPLIFAAGLLGAWLLDRYVYPLPLPWDRYGPASRVGVMLVAIGLLLSAWGGVTFRRARTAIIPIYSASRLVVTGPYRFTRNPMYTGMTLAYLGATLLLHTAWAFLLLPVVLLTLTRFVIRREERYLEHAFGSEYADYRARVRRWL